MRRIYASAFLLLLLSGAFAQERLLFSHSCNYSGEIDPGDLYGFASDDEAEDALKRIMRYTGLPANFTIVAANVPNAAAAIYQGKRYILYNQYFMYRIKDQTKTDWAALSILAHEIGHHLAGHTLDELGSRPGKELEADRFSGFMLYKMGASLEDALIVMETLASDTGTSTHPPKSARVAAMTNGWMEARQQGADINPILEKQPETAEAPVEATIVVEASSAEFRKIWVEHTAVGQIEGLRIHTHFNINNLSDHPCRAVVWFYDVASGEPLEDMNNRFTTANGDVAIMVDFTPNKSRAEYTDFPMFIPYEELHLEDGKYAIQFQIGLYGLLPSGQLQQVGPVSEFTALEFHQSSD